METTKKTLPNIKIDQLAIGSSFCGEGSAIPFYMRAIRGIPVRIFRYKWNKEKGCLEIVGYLDE